MQKFKTTIYLLSSLLLIISINNSDAQTLSQNIRGVVTDAVTNAPLYGATVSLISNKKLKGTITDENGEFVLPNISLGRQTIKISYIGYKTRTIGNLLLSSGKELFIQVKLEENVTNVSEITVSANKNKAETINEMAIVSARTFSVEETERFAGSLGDPARMVANYAGVGTQNDTRNDIIIRGNSPMGVLWRLEGVEIGNPNHFGASGTTGGPVSMINNNLLSNSDFLTGAFPAEYGNALSGAFDLNLRSGNSHKYEFVGQVGFNGFELGAEGPMFKTRNNPKASFLINYRYSTLEAVSKMGFSLGTGTAVPEYKDLTFIIDVPGSKIGRFKLFGLFGNSYIELGREYLRDDKTSYNGVGTAVDFGAGLGVLGLSHRYFVTKKLSVLSTLSYQDNYSNTKYDSIHDNGNQVQSIARFYDKEKKLALTSKLIYKYDTKNNFNIGIIIDQYLINTIDSVFLNEFGKFVNLLDVSGKMNLFQGYIQWHHNFSNNFSGYVGVHSQYYDGNNDLTVEPRIGLKLKMNKNQSLTFGFGMHSQTQPKAIYFLQTYDSTYNSYSYTNKNLQFTQSNHLVLGYNNLLTNNLRLKIETYYQHLYNVPVSKSNPEFSMLNTGNDFVSAMIDSLTNKGTGNNYGVELTFEKFLDKGYYFLLTTSLFNSTYKGYDKVKRNTAFNGNYIVNALAGYEYKFNDKYMLTFDLRLTYAGGKRYVPIDMQKSQAFHTTKYDWTNAYKDKYDDYFRTDLRIGFKQNNRKFSQEWGVDFQNITNYKSIFMEQYDVVKISVSKTYQQGFFPMFLYRIRF